MKGRWTQEPGYPLLVLEEKDGHISSYQQRFFSNPSEPAQPSDWQIPLAIVTPSGTEQVLYTNEHAAEFNAMLEQRIASERWVKVNQNTLCLVQYPESMQKRLEAAIQSRELGALDRIQLVLDMKRLCNAQRVKPSQVLAFLQCYQTEDDWSVLEVVCSLLQNVSTFPLFEIQFFGYIEDSDTALRAKFQQFARSLFPRFHDW